MGSRKQRGRAIHGILLLDKAPGCSSNSALQQVKTLYQARKAGHTGSLDPLATGVLPLCLGEATKLSRFVLDADKCYRVRLQLGQRTDTGDSEGAVIASGDVSTVTRPRLVAALQHFQGEIAQVPPMHSAIKQHGVPLYKLARQGLTVARQPRTVRVHRLALVEFTGSQCELDIACSKGTYIRTIADDLGQQLGCGAHVQALRRTAAGVFEARRCVDLDTLRAAKADGGLPAIDRWLLPPDAAVSNLPAVRLPEVTAACVRQGQPVLVRHLPAAGLVRLYQQQQFIGIGGIDEDGRVAPKRLIAI